MKTTNRALLVASMASAMATGGCGRQKSYFTIDGILQPPASGCTYSYQKQGPFIGEGELYLAIQKEELSSPYYLLGLSVSNGLSTNVTIDPSGKPIELTSRNDVVIQEIDVEFTADPGSPAIPTQVIKLNAVVPAGGGASVGLNLLAATGSAAVAKITKNAHYYATITLKGDTQSGSTVESDPFVFGLVVNATTTSAGFNTFLGCDADSHPVFAGCGAQDVIPTCGVAPTTTPPTQ